MEYIPLALLVLVGLALGTSWGVRRLHLVGELERRLKNLETQHGAALRRLASLEERFRKPLSAMESNLSPEEPVGSKPAKLIVPTPTFENERDRPTTTFAVDSEIRFPLEPTDSKPVPGFKMVEAIGDSPIPKVSFEEEGSNSPTQAIPSFGASSEPFELVRRFFSQWNPVVLGGAMLVLLGVVFLLGLAAQNGLFPVPVRLVGACLLAGFLFVAGWKQRTARPTWAFPLQGTGFAILFFVFYAAHHKFQILSIEMAFAGSVIVLAATGVLAVLQSSQRLALLAVGAGFLAPILFSKGSGSPVGLFVDYVLLDLGVVAMVRLRGWKPLLALAFLFTYSIATTWGVLRYDPQNFSSCEGFLWVFYVLFSTSTIGFSRKGVGNPKGLVSGSLVFGLPLATFGLQAKLCEGDRTILAWTAVGMCLHHLLAGLWVLRRGTPENKERGRVLAEALLVLGTILGTVAVPLALSGRWTSLAWAVEGAGLVWLSVRQGRLWNLAMGSLLVLGATLLHLRAEEVSGVDAAILVLSLLAVARCLDWPTLPIGAQTKASRAVVALAWLVGTMALREILHSSLTENVSAWVASVIAMTCTFSGLSRVRWWRWGGFHFGWIPATVLWGALLLGNLGGWQIHEWMGWIAWIVVPLLGMLFLERARQEGEPSREIRLTLESVFLHGGVLAVCLQTAHQISSEVWANGLAWTLAAFLLWGFTHSRWARWSWAASRPHLQQGPWLLPWVGALVLWTVASLFREGSGGPLPWLPLANSADVPAFAFLATFLVMPFSVIPWRADLRQFRLRSGVAIFLFVWMTTTLCRAFHFWGNVPWVIGELWNSRALQSAWSLLLTAQALSMCWIASRRSWRPLWFLGAILLGLVTIKLLSVDLSGTGSVARIVSFLGAGLLMVGIGYVSPAPPSQGPKTER